MMMKHVTLFVAPIALALVACAAEPVAQESEVEAEAPSSTDESESALTSTCANHPGTAVRVTRNTNGQWKCAAGCSPPGDVRADARIRCQNAGLGSLELYNSCSDGRFTTTWVFKCK